MRKPYYDGASHMPQPPHTAARTKEPRGLPARLGDTFKTLKEYPSRPRVPGSETAGSAAALGTPIACGGATGGLRMTAQMLGETDSASAPAVRALRDRVFHDDMEDLVVERHVRPRAEG